VVGMRGLDHRRCARKAGHRAQRRANALGRSRPGEADSRRESLAPPDTRDPRTLLERILDTPNLPQVVPRLQPEILHRIIQGCGLEDCGELVALATPAQLAVVFDRDLWRSDRPGLADQLDAGRFGLGLRGRW